MYKGCYELDVNWKEYLIDVAITIVAVYGFMWLFNRVLHIVLAKISFVGDKKASTIESVLKTSLSFIAFLVVVVALLQPFVDLTKLMAGAGVLGVVIGFGAQSLIKDILTGFFFLFENQFQKGDVVTINQKYTGTVEEVGFRALKVRDWGGRLLTISNGEIKEILNGNVEKRRIVEPVVASYYEDPKKVVKVLEEACVELNVLFNDHLIIDFEGVPEEVFQVRGISNLNSMHHGYEYTVIGLVKDDEYFDIMYRARELIAHALYENKIQMADQKVRVENY